MKYLIRTSNILTFLLRSYFTKIQPHWRVSIRLNDTSAVAYFFEATLLPTAPYRLTDCRQHSVSKKMPSANCLRQIQTLRANCVQSHQRSIYIQKSRGSVPFSPFPFRAPILFPSRQCLTVSFSPLPSFQEFLPPPFLSTHAVTQSAWSRCDTSQCRVSFGQLPLLTNSEAHIHCRPQNTTRLVLARGSMVRKQAPDQYSDGDKTPVPSLIYTPTNSIPKKSTRTMYRQQTLKCRLPLKLYTFGMAAFVTKLIFVN